MSDTPEYPNLYPWHISHWHMISASFRQARYPHALLLEGPAGLGKHQFAQQLAAKVLCNPTADVACGQCRSCRLFAADSHPDFYSVGVLEKASVIKIDQIRELIDRLSQTAHEGGFQVVLIHSAESMNHAASNALLKTLEEPSGQVLIILVVDYVENLPPTILSRCQRLRFSDPAYEITVPWLVAQGIGDESEARALLHMASGSPLRALEYASPSRQALRKTVMEIAGSVLGNVGSPVDITSLLAEYPVEDVMDVIFSMACDLLKICLNVPDAELANRDYRHLLHSFSANMNPVHLSMWLSNCLQTSHRLRVTRGMNATLALESLLFTIKT